MTQLVPYCGSAPSPVDLATRFNFDPILIVALALICTLQVLAIRRHRGAAIAGWLCAAAAWISPLCALSVSLFSARVAQHVVLMMIAAPLIASAWPKRITAPSSVALWPATGLFFALLWFWQMPALYESTFASTPVYWTMHITLLGSSLWLWRELLHHSREQTLHAVGAGALTIFQMALLGAVLALGFRPLFTPHLVTTQAWGLSPLQDQQVGGAIMWVPGISWFLWTALRSFQRLFGSLSRVRPA